MWNNVINAWWPLVFYPATDAPKFTKGMWAMIGVSIATLGVTWSVCFLERREKRLRSSPQDDIYPSPEERKDGQMGGQDEEKA